MSKGLPREFIGINKFCDSNCLIHYGILGMKWGVRHDYEPTGDRQRSGSYSSDRSEKVKKAIKIGAAIALTGLAAYGGYKLIQNSKKQEIESGEQVVKQIFQPHNSLGDDAISDKAREYLQNRDKTAIDENTGLHLKEAITSIEDDASKVNPNFNGEVPDKFDVIGQYAMRNCGLCSATFDLRRRGYDVIAGFSDQPMTKDTVESWFKGGKFEKLAGDFETDTLIANKSMSGSSAKNIVSKLSKNGQSRGILAMAWGGSGGGHYTSYTVDDKGIFSIVDTQSSKIYTGDEALSFLEKTSALEVMRTDNIEPDIELMKKVGVIR